MRRRLVLDRCISLCKHTKKRPYFDQSVICRTPKSPRFGTLSSRDTVHYEGSSWKPRYQSYQSHKIGFGSGLGPGRFGRTERMWQIDMNRLKVKVYVFLQKVKIRFISPKFKSATCEEFVKNDFFRYFISPNLVGKILQKTLFRKMMPSKISLCWPPE